MADSPVRNCYGLRRFVLSQILQHWVNENDNPMTSCSMCAYENHDEFQRRLLGYAKDWIDGRKSTNLPDWVFPVLESADRTTVKNL